MIQQTLIHVQFLRQNSSAFSYMRDSAEMAHFKDMGDLLIAKAIFMRGSLNKDRDLGLEGTFGQMGIYTRGNGDGTKYMEKGRFT